VAVAFSPDGERLLTTACDTTATVWDPRTGTRLMDASGYRSFTNINHNGAVFGLIDRDVPSYFRSLEHLLRYCARPPFALERLSVSRGADGELGRTQSQPQVYATGSERRRRALAV